MVCYIPIAKECSLAPSGRALAARHCRAPEHSRDSACSFLSSNHSCGGACMPEDRNIIPRLGPSVLAGTYVISFPRFLQSSPLRCPLLKLSANIVVFVAYLRILSILLIPATAASLITDPVFLSPISLSCRVPTARDKESLASLPLWSGWTRSQTILRRRSRRTNTMRRA